MPLKETLTALQELLAQMQRDLIKASRENQSAAQRVRTRSVHFAKLAKIYRQESLAAEKARRKK